MSGKVSNKISSKVSIEASGKVISKITLYYGIRLPLLTIRGELVFLYLYRKGVLIDERRVYL